MADGVRLEHWQTRTTGPWTELLAGAAAVINLCGESIAGPRWTESRKRRLTESRVGPSEALVDAVCNMEDPPAVFIQASGVGYMGTGEAPGDESAPPGDDFLARLAVAWEAPLVRLPIRCVTLRFGVILARDGGALPRMLLPFRLLAGGPIGSGRQWLSWIHVDDAVAAIRFAMTHPLSGPVHATAPEPVRNADFARLAGRVLHRPCWLPVPRAVMTAALGEQATLVCDGQQAMPAKLLDHGFRHDYPNVHEALKDLLTTGRLRVGRSG